MNVWCGVRFLRDICNEISFASKVMRPVIFGFAVRCEAAAMPRRPQPDFAPGAMPLVRA
jgi:hypothetical protein